MVSEENSVVEQKINIPAEFTVFRLKYPITSLEVNVVFWNGTDPSGFFSLANEMGAKSIYIYSEGSADNGKEPVVEKDEFAFMIDGVFHVLSAVVDTKTGKPIRRESKSMPEVSKERGHALQERDPEELSSEMASFVKANLDYMSPDPFNLQYFFKKFWESHGVDTSVAPGSEQRKLMNKIENMAALKIKSL
jgi:hypothetical protein